MTKTLPPCGPYTTKSATLNSSLPHTGIISVGQINTCKLFDRLCTASHNCLNTKSATKGAGDHKKYSSNDNASRCHRNYYFLPSFHDIL